MAKSSEAAVVQLFTEVRRHKPSVIYIPNVDVWYKTVGAAVISTFLSLLRTLAPTDPVLLLGILECEDENIDPQMVKDLFGFSRKNQFDIPRPDRVSFLRNVYRKWPKSNTSIAITPRVFHPGSRLCKYFAIRVPRARRSQEKTV